MQQTSIVKEFQGHNLQDCSGNYLQNCKDTNFSYDCEDVEGGKYCYQVVLAAKNVYDIYQYGTNLQQSLECSICGENGYHLLFCIDCHMNCTDLLYCWYMDRSKNCFGCADMHDKQYCILNKQYSKEEYEVLVPKIIEHMQKSPSTCSARSHSSLSDEAQVSESKTGSHQGCEWGEFFPKEIAIHGYNKTTAQLYYPLTKEQAGESGLVWDDTNGKITNIKKVIPADRLPDNITDIPDDILAWAIECETTGKRFRIEKNELQFYREQKLPIPRRCREQRHYDRFTLRNHRKLCTRQCSKCKEEIQTTYTPDRPETVYCESCYLKDAY